MASSVLNQSYRVILSQTRRSSVCHHVMSRPLSSTLLPSVTSSCGLSRFFASTSQTARPFQVLGLQQIAIGSLDKAPLSNLWSNIFGVPKIGNYKSEKENVDEDILLLGKKGSPLAVEIDLMVC